MDASPDRSAPDPSDTPPRRDVEPRPTYATAREEVAALRAMLKRPPADEPPAAPPPSPPKP